MTLLEDRSPRAEEGAATPAPIVLAPLRQVRPGAQEATEVPVLSADELEANRDRRRRRVVVGVVGALAVVVVLHAMALLMYEYRQSHRSDEFLVATKKVEIGDASLLLQIPSIGMNQTVVEGASDRELRSGPGRVLGTPMPGEAGNAVILGRSFRYGAPFADLDRITNGAEIAVQSRTGGMVGYKVVDVGRRAIDDPSILAPTATSTLTLVTRTGPFGDEALVVRAELSTGTAKEARAARTVSDPLDEHSRGAVCAALMTLLLAGLVIGLAPAWRVLRRRHDTPVLVGIALPAAAVWLAVLLMVVDQILPVAF